MPPTILTQYLRPHHPKSRILFPHQRSRNRIKERRPSTSALELLLCCIQRCIAPRAGVHALVGVVFVVLAGVRGFGARLAQDAELFGGENSAPFGVGLLDGEGHVGRARGGGGDRAHKLAEDAVVAGGCSGERAGNAGERASVKKRAKVAHQNGGSGSSHGEGSWYLSRWGASGDVTEGGLGAMWVGQSLGSVLHLFRAGRSSPEEVGGATHNSLHYFIPLSYYKESLMYAVQLHRLLR